MGETMTLAPSAAELDAALPAVPDTRPGALPEAPLAMPTQALERAPAPRRWLALPGLRRTAGD